MEKKENKIKKFCQKNKEEITKFAWLVIGGTIGCCSMAYAMHETYAKSAVTDEYV